MLQSHKIHLFFLVHARHSCHSYIENLELQGDAMDLPTVPLVTEGAEAEVLLSGWLEKLVPCVGHGGKVPAQIRGKSMENCWYHGDMAGESRKKLGTMTHRKGFDQWLEICWKSSCIWISWGYLVGIEWGLQILDIIFGCFWEWLYRASDDSCRRWSIKMYKNLYHPIRVPGDVFIPKHENKSHTHTIPHRIHGAGIYANIWGILMVNVTIYSIHGSYGY